MEIYFEKKSEQRIRFRPECTCGDQKAIAWTEKKILIITDKTLMTKRLNDKENIWGGGGYR